MHSIRMINKDNWEVVLIRSDEPRLPLFHRLSFGTALKLCNHLNGGNTDFGCIDLSIIERCAVK